VEHWILRHRGGTYALMCAGLLFGGAFGVALGNAPTGTATYACLLTMLCLMPALWMERVNDRYALLAVFMGAYFNVFRWSESDAGLVGSDSDTVSEVRDGFMTTAQVAVLLGAVLTLVGYRIGASRVPRSAEGTAATDWSNAAVFAVGVVCWVAGSFALVYYAIVVTPENSMRATAQGLAAMGPVLTFLVMLGQTVQPLGPWYSAYGYAKNRTPVWLLLVLTVIVLQLVLGFVIDQKGLALLGVLLVAICKPCGTASCRRAGWRASSSSRSSYSGISSRPRAAAEAGLDRQQALERIDQVLARAWSPGKIERR